MKYFRLSEFDQEGLEGSGENMDEGFLKRLDELRHACGFPFIISSGYRTPEYNAKISRTGYDGPHTTGRAADILAHGNQAHEILKLAGLHGFTGIGIRQKGSYSSRFIHLDDLPEAEGRPRPWVWTY